MKFLNFKTGIIILSIILLLAAGGIGYYFIQQNMPKPTAQEEAKTLAVKVSKLIDLPNEQPTIATITDPAQLQDQSFFAKALVGDKVLVYASIGKAILYRPSLNKIIDVTTVNIPTPTVPNVAAGEAGSPSPTISSILKIAFYNGTATSGLTKVAETLLKDKKYDFQVAIRSNAIQKYETTLVVDISKKNGEMANILAKDLNGAVGELPPNEATASATPNKADILIFLGNSTPK